MSETEKSILIAPTGSLRDVDKAALRKGGVMIVETDKPEEVRLLDAEAMRVKLPEGALMRAVGEALRKSATARDAFGLAIARELTGTEAQTHD